jgi:hypothetical protein
MVLKKKTLKNIATKINHIQNYIMFEFNYELGDVKM